MGHGIAQVAALAGYDTRITDANTDALQPALERIRANLDGGVKRGKIDSAAAADAFKRIMPSDAIASAVADADLVIEAVVEDLDVKQQLFREVAAHSPAHATLATNTSSLSVARIADTVADPGRVVGMHFFNPVHIMKLVEVVSHARADAVHVDERVVSVARAMGKEPIQVQDAPGFASSRLGVVLGLEAMRMVEQGGCCARGHRQGARVGIRAPDGPAARKRSRGVGRSTRDCRLPAHGAGRRPLRGAGDSARQSRPW